MLHHYVIVYSHVAGGLISHMHVVSLLGETDEGAAHRDHVIIGVRRKDEHTLGEGVGRYGTCGVVTVGLATGPS